MIRDQLAEHTNDSKVREILITASDDLTITKAVEIAFKVDSAVEFASQLAGHTLSQPRLATKYNILHGHLAQSPCLMTLVSI